MLILIFAYWFPHSSRIIRRCLLMAFYLPQTIAKILHNCQMQSGTLTIEDDFISLIEANKKLVTKIEKSSNSQTDHTKAG